MTQRCLDGFWIPARAWQSYAHQTSTILFHSQDWRRNSMIEAVRWEGLKSCSRERALQNGGC
jgi:hypothetical protein